MKTLSVLLVGGLFWQSVESNAGVQTLKAQGKNIVTVSAGGAERNLMEKNALVFSCGCNGKNVPGFEEANESEEISSDAFFVSGSRVFLDDTLNQRILIYKNGKYEKNLSLDWNMDVQQMFYDEENNILKMVYMDLEADDATYLYLLEMDVDRGEILFKKQLSNADKSLLEYCFDTAGNLLTHYWGDSVDGTFVQDATGELPEIFSEDYTAETVSVDLEEKQKAVVYTDTSLKEDGTEIKECIVVKGKNGKEKYAVPEEHEGALEAGLIQMSGDNIYQMVVAEDGIKIFRLSQKDIKSETITVLERKVNMGGVEETTYSSQVQTECF